MDNKSLDQKDLKDCFYIECCKYCFIKNNFVDNINHIHILYKDHLLYLKDYFDDHRYSSIHTGEREMTLYEYAENRYFHKTNILLL